MLHALHAPVGGRHSALPAAWRWQKLWALSACLLLLTTRAPACLLLLVPCRSAAGSILPMLPEGAEQCGLCQWLHGLPQSQAAWQATGPGTGMLLGLTGQTCWRCAQPGCHTVARCMPATAS